MSPIVLDIETRPGRTPPPTPGKEGRTIAVTGGAGFIGSHLCRALLDQGCAVVCLDNFYTGRHANIDALKERPAFQCVEHDIVDPLPAWLPRFDEIYNLACPASPVHYQADPVKTALVCAAGGLNVLKRAERDGARVFHASTSEIYGDPDVHPQPESYFGNVNTTGPRSCYDEGKRFAETLFSDFCAQGGLDLRIARIFNTFGPRMQPDDGRVVSNFVIQALKGEPITLYGDGAQTRSFCYVDDLVDGFLRLMTAPAAGCSPTNLGNPHEITVRELAHLIVAMTGSDSEIVHLPLPVDDPRRRRPDITKAQSELGWGPKVSLREGLERTIDYFAAEIGQTAAADPRLRLASA